MNELEFDPLLNNLRMIQRCQNKLEAWKAVYSLLDIPFRYSNPTDEEINAYLRKVALQYKGLDDRPKKP